MWSGLDALKQAGCERIFEDTMSGAKAERPGLQGALSHLRRDDTLVVWKLDRLGRTTRGLINLLESLKERGIGFKTQNRHVFEIRQTVMRLYDLFPTRLLHCAPPDW
jgi:DNA invertase Pin-like site-specific DNA recombinase